MSAPRPIRITIEDFTPVIACQPGETFLQAAGRAGLALATACGGEGRCRSCAVRVVSATVPDIGVGEAGVFSAAQLDMGWRRACRMRPQADCTVHVPRRALLANARHLIPAQGFARLPVAPMIVSETVTLPKADGGIWERLQQGLGQKGARIDIDALRILSAPPHQPAPRLRAFLRGDEVIGVGDHKSRAYGVAVDLGTTGISAFLINLTTGATVAAITAPNPQAAFGGDVVSRLTRAIRDAGERRALRDTVVDGLNGLIGELCANAMIAADQVMDLVIAGNTAMHHLFAGLPVAQLGKAPFAPCITQAMDIKARDLGIHAAPGAYVHLPGIIAGYVGSDHTCALLAAGQSAPDALTLLVDIGTNTEISLIGDGRIVSASCPSGPALEGGHISCGMPAAEGAISAVKLTGNAPELTTIGDAAPIGICGSGVLDMVAQLLRSGAMNARGRLQQSHPQVQALGGRLECVLVADGPDGTISFSQDDIRAVQLAKAAIRAGIDLLLKTRKQRESDIQRILLAGAFGSHINLKSAIITGLLPDLPPKRLKQIGNGAGTGARLALTSATHRETARQLARDTHYVELAGRKDFMRVFVGRMGFGAEQTAPQEQDNGS